jgi:hypothetical protein
MSYTLRVTTQVLEILFHHINNLLQIRVHLHTYMSHHRVHLEVRRNASTERERRERGEREGRGGEREGERGRERDLVQEHADAFVHCRDILREQKAYDGVHLQGFACAFRA